MNAHKWIAHFETNANSWQEPDWTAPCTLTDLAAKQALTASLATFQLGESGGGTRLMRFARQLADDEKGGVGTSGPDRFSDYEKAVNLFIKEENYHAEILARLVRHLGGTLIEKHWTNSVFRGVRSLINLEFNIQVLLTAELIAEAYYGLLYKHAKDPVITNVCGKILRDEIKHIAFHLDFFSSRFKSFSPARRALWSAQFRTLFLATASVVWLDHRPAFEAVGVERAKFHATAQNACHHFLNRFSKIIARKDRGSNFVKRGVRKGV